MALSALFTNHYGLDFYRVQFDEDCTVTVAKNGNVGTASSEQGEFLTALTACEEIGLDTSAPPAPPSGYPGPVATPTDMLLTHIQAPDPHGLVVRLQSYHGGGLLADRPAASTVLAGSIYSATDDNGGTIYVKQGSAWAKIAPSVADTSGTVLASAWPSAAISALTVGTTAGVDRRVPELTTAPFVMPSRPVRIAMNQMSGTIPSGADVVLQLKVDKANAGTYAAGSFSLGIQNAANTVTSARWMGGHYAIPSTIAAPGDTVKVALFISRATTDGSVTLNNVPAFGIHAGFDVIAL